MKIGVIGAGIGGMAVALRLVMRGHDVTVLEKNDRPGGKLSEIRWDGFRFDTGPSLFTLPQQMEELFNLAGKELADYLPYRLLPVNCRYFYPDGAEFSFYHDKEQLVKEIQQTLDQPPAAVLKRLKEAKEVYALGAPVFLFRPFGKLSDFRTPAYRKIGRQFYKLDFFRTMHQANRKDFTDPRMVQLFDRYATYNGSDPYRAPATLNMIAHLENNLGAYFPEKGMYSIVEALYQVGITKGVEFRMNTTVEEVFVKDKRVTGLRTSSGDQKYDLYVSEMDAGMLANRYMKHHPLRKRLNRAEKSTSAMIFYWGMKRAFPVLELHNIFFSSDYQAEFVSLFRKKEIPEEPTVYLFISSRVVKEDAPEGCENWFVMVNAPADAGQDWDALRKKTRKKIIRILNERLRIDIESWIAVEEVADPLTIEENTGSEKGALYGVASNSMFSAFLRHPNQLSGIENLYFTGGSVHPGGGIPLCLASAGIVDEEIAQKYGG
ncbi:MAG: phytoene desaturase [Tannerellaceae bacterium]|nr:phytoene desaturase [Tannerellaceae bacterium]